MRVILHPAADQELIEATAYYGAIDPSLGERFLREIEKLLRDIHAHPLTFREFDPPARRHFSLVFPYGIIYLQQDDLIWIVAIMHMKRQPGYWRGRMV